MQTPRGRLSNGVFGITHRFTLLGVASLSLAFISYKPDLAPLKASLQGRAGFLAACVRFACEIERATAGDHLNVGGGISIVTVSLDGEISYTPPLNGFS